MDTKIAKRISNCFWEECIAFCRIWPSRDYPPPPSAKGEQHDFGWIFTQNAYFRIRQKVWDIAPSTPSALCARRFAMKIPSLRVGQKALKCVFQVLNTSWELVLMPDWSSTHMQLFCWKWVLVSDTYWFQTIPQIVRYAFVTSARDVFNFDLNCISEFKQWQDIVRCKKCSDSYVYCFFGTFAFIFLILPPGNEERSKDKKYEVFGHRLLRRGGELSDV